MSSSEKDVNYSVVFNGEIIPGYNKSDVLKKLMQITRLTKEQAEKKFFDSGKVVIKKTSDLDKAKRYHNKFIKAGMAVGIQMDFEEEDE